MVVSNIRGTSVPLCQNWRVFFWVFVLVRCIETVRNLAGGFEDVLFSPPEKKKEACWLLTKHLVRQKNRFADHDFTYEYNIEVFSDRRQEHFEVFFIFFFVFVFCAFPIVQDRTTWDSWQKGLDVAFFQPSGDQFHPTFFFVWCLGIIGSFIPNQPVNFRCPENFSKIRWQDVLCQRLKNQTWEAWQIPIQRFLGNGNMAVPWLP